LSALQLSRARVLAEMLKAAKGGVLTSEGVSRSVLKC
jgi:hypothetical protein